MVVLARHSVALQFDKSCIWLVCVFFLRCMQAMKIIAAIFACVAASFLVALIGIRCYKPIAVWSQSLRSQLHTVFV